MKFCFAVSYNRDKRTFGIHLLRVVNRFWGGRVMVLQNRHCDRVELRFAAARITATLRPSPGYLLSDATVSGPWQIAGRSVCIVWKSNSQSVELFAIVPASLRRFDDFCAISIPWARNK